MSVFRDDPYPAFNFLVELPVLEAPGDAVVAGFAEIDGLAVEQESILYRNGNERTLAPRRIPGLVRHPPLVMKRGVTGNAALWEWMQRCTQGRGERVNATISLLDEQRQVVMQWRVHGAMPRKLSGPTLNANASEVAIETLELAHDGVELRD